MGPVANTGWIIRGSASAVAGGLVPIATGGDGGGSIRIPAGFCGLVGLKGTFGRIPRSPKTLVGNLTVSIGSLTRSIRDTARWFDVTNGFDPRDTLSLPKVTGWETQLGTYTEALHGSCVAVIPDWGGATVSPAMWDVLTDAAAAIIGSLGMRQLEIDSTLPSMGAAWSISGMIAIRAELGDRWPACEGDSPLKFGLVFATPKASTTKTAEPASKNAAWRSLSGWPTSSMTLTS